jgi:aminoglycoside phosphotransferase family enzyme/predicted kinase
MRMSQELEHGGQSEVIAFLGRAETYGSSAATVERIETHGAMVFLAGSEVYKIKRAVEYPYMDFSTLDLRRRACAREVEINRPHAPGIYLGVVAITRERDGTLAFDGGGDPVEWAVRMRRFPADCLMSRIADAGGLDTGLARDIGDAVADYHETSQIASTAAPTRGLAGVIVEVTSGLAEARIGDGPSVAALTAGLREALARVSGLLTRRAGAGFVRRCHGDLHLGNMVLFEGRATAFDALEFDEDMATIDTLYDLAFLLMDLDMRGRRAAANAVLNRYLWRTQADLDLEGLAALPLLLALRAGIRAMVMGQQAELAGGDEQSGKRKSAERYLAAARAFLFPSQTRVVAVGGLSGTGKSTLAAALAPEIGRAPGAIHLRSDLERKSMFGVGEMDRLGAECYAGEATRRVYERLGHRMRLAAGAGQSVVVDATFSEQAEREEVQAAARSLGIPFIGIWLTARAETLISRVAARRGDASDADVDVVRNQLRRSTGPMDWISIDAEGAPQDALRLARVALQGVAGSG